MTAINLDQKFSCFTEHWRPKVIASLNGQEVRIVKVQGEFPWHHHDTEDELFLVWKGRFRVEFRDRIVELGPETVSNRPIRCVKRGAESILRHRCRWPADRSRPKLRQRRRHWSLRE